MRPIHYFTHPHGNDDKVVRQELLVIKFILVSLLFAIGYFVNSYFNGFLMARYAMVLCVIFFVMLLYAYKFRIISVAVTSHLFIIACYFIVVVLSIASRSINSYVLPWVALIPIMALILNSAFAAWVWSGIGAVTVLLMLVVKPEQLLPPHLLYPGSNLLTVTLHIGLLLITLWLTYIFDLQKSDLFKTIEKQNIDLQQSRQIIEAQHQILIEKNEGLEHEIQTRTRELVEYNQQLEQFAYISSHNLRAPIARIMGLGELLSRIDDAEEDEIIKNELVQAAHQLDRVVRDLNMILDIRKSSDLLVNQLEVRKELNQLLLNLEKEIADTQALINIDTEQVPILNTVKPYFDSIFINLIGNAIKYRKPDEKPVIDIAATWQDGFACFTVRDNGLGIDLTTSRKKLFTLYSRFHEHTEGKGMGLFMVKTQLDSMGGRIEVESAPGIGTTFHVYFKTARS